MTMCRLASVVVLVTGGMVGRLQAACTVIPDPPFIRGARGSIDRPFLSPDVDEAVTVRAGRSTEASSPQVFDPRNVLITAVFKADANPAAPFYIAGDDDCEHLEQPACFVERLFCRQPHRCVTGSAVGLTAGVENGVEQLRFRFPQTHAAGPVVLAVTNAHQPPPAELQSESCGALKKSGLRSDLAVCIDAFRLPDIDPPGVEPLTMQLIALPASNDYQAMCTKDVGDTPFCTGKAADVWYTVDGEGNVLVPMSWGGILRKEQSGQFGQRQLRTSTAVEAVLGQAKRVYVPSAAFLETVSQQGGGFTPSPVFAPQELPDRLFEQTFFGTADKGKSVLKFKRRTRWDHVCGAGVNQSQACEPASEADDCPGAQCVSASPAYFACVGGARNAQPCTRPQHCDGGTCQNVSVSGSVCYAQNGVPTGTACKLDSDCGMNGECGAGLFEYRNRLVNGVGVLHRSASSSAPGVCDSGTHVGQPCTGAVACNGFIFGPAACVTYRADALTYSQPPP